MLGRDTKTVEKSVFPWKKTNVNLLVMLGTAMPSYFSAKLNWKTLREGKERGRRDVHNYFFSFPPLPLHSCRKIPLNFSLNNKCRKLLKAYEVGVYFLVPNSKAVSLEEKYTLKGWMMF